MNSFLTFIAASLLCAVGVPRLWLTAYIGLKFSPPTAFTISILAAMSGSYLTFIFGRHLNRETLAKYLKFKIAQKIRGTNPGILETLLLRKMPFPGVLSTLALSTTNIKLPAFLIGSFIGFLPTTIITVFIGDAATNPHSKEYIAISTVIIILAVLLMLAIKYHLKRAHSNIVISPVPRQTSENHAPEAHGTSPIAPPDNTPAQ